MDESCDGRRKRLKIEDDLRKIGITPEEGRVIDYAHVPESLLGGLSQ